MMPDFDKVSYSQFFDVDENYFPCIDDSAIQGGAKWDNTYPHKTFIRMMRASETMLGGSTNRSLWIHGSYGTGKSQCVYTLMKLLSVPEEELEAYWQNYEALQDEQDLKARLIGHRQRNILTVYRYASGSIHNLQAFFRAVQESVSAALKKDSRISYYGGSTLKEAVIAWMEQPGAAALLDAQLQLPEWRAVFPQQNSAEILEKLKNPRANTDELMENLFKLADKVGITAMMLDADKLKKWLKDIIETNHITIVFFWDEFSDFFKHNRSSLGDFQQVVALCQECPFYMVIVTHQTSEVIDERDEGWKVVQQRFERVEITLPDNIAFELIGHAFKEKPAAKETWNAIKDELYDRLPSSRTAVMKAVHLDNHKVIKEIMPIHPMTALVLKNIASAFASNQRSMFDFIKTKHDEQDAKAFQWFINNYGPGDDHPLLTIDMLWDFFYERGKNNLTPDIRMILDAYASQGRLREDEQRVLKTVLIMQAIDTRYGGEIALMKPTEQNISYAFEGIASGLDSACKNIAKKLEHDGVLVKKPLGNGKYAYEVAVLAGDQSKINARKKEVRQNSTTETLAAQGELAGCLSLPACLRWRFGINDAGDLETVTLANFTRKVNAMREADTSWRFLAVLAIAKDNGEGAGLRKKIKEAASQEEYTKILFIDATENVLGEENLDSYVDFSAMALYYQSNNGATARENNAKAKNVLTAWKSSIYNGSFIVYSHDNPEGERLQGGQNVADAMKARVLKKFSRIPDFGNGLTEAQFKLTNAKAAALCGINQKTSGVMQGAEKSVLGSVWGVEAYWEKPETSALDISVIKRDVDTKMEASFKASGQVPILDVLELLERVYGYSNSNLTAFMVGFLLKEYSGSPYRYTDQRGTREEMKPDKLGEMISNGLKSQNQTYIVKMTPEEKSFYDTTEIAWGIAANTLSSPAKAASCVQNAMQRLGMPLWCLREVDESAIYAVLEQYLSFVKAQGQAVQQIMSDIGKSALDDAGLGDSLRKFLTEDNCRQGMLLFLKHFEEGKLLDLADSIGAKDYLLDDINRIFSSVEYASLWDEGTGHEQIRKLMVEYAFVLATNNIIDSAAHSKREAVIAWQEKLKFTLCSCERLQELHPDMVVWGFLKKIALSQDILPDQMQGLVDAINASVVVLKEYFADEADVFAKIYRDYLENLTSNDIKHLAPDLVNIFIKSRTESNKMVKEAADKARKNQLRTQVFQLWKEKTGSANPRDWSARHRTPILNVISAEEYAKAKKVFNALNSSYPAQNELKAAHDFLQESTSLARLHDDRAVEAGFMKILGKFRSILTDIDKVKDALDSLAVDAYDWNDDPLVQEKLQKMAQLEYDAGGSDRAVAKIEAMGSEELKRYLIEQVRSQMNLGLEIINEGR